MEYVYICTASKHTRRRCQEVRTTMSPSEIRAATGHSISCTHGPMRLVGTFNPCDHADDERRGAQGE